MSRAKGVNAPSDVSGPDLTEPRKRTEFCRSEHLEVNVGVDSYDSWAALRSRVDALACRDAIA
ncbi:hypothetical protein GCM10009657_16290 [Oryzihumus leptocrescens]